MNFEVLLQRKWSRDYIYIEVTRAELYFQLKVSDKDKFIPTETFNYIPMFSLFRTLFFSHVGWGYHQWPCLPLHLKEKKEERWKQRHRARADRAGWRHSPPHRPRARRPRRAPPRAPCHPRGQSIGLDGDYCSPAAPVESRAQLMGHPQRSLQSPAPRQRPSLCLTHPQTPPSQGKALPLFAVPSAPSTQPWKFQEQWHRGTPTLCVTSATASPCSNAL